MYLNSLFDKKKNFTLLHMQIRPRNYFFYLFILEPVAIAVVYPAEYIDVLKWFGW